MDLPINYFEHFKIAKMARSLVKLTAEKSMCCTRVSALAGSRPPYRRSAEDKQTALPHLPEVTQKEGAEISWAP